MEWSLVDSRGNRMEENGHETDKKRTEMEVRRMETKRNRRERNGGEMEKKSKERIRKCKECKGAEMECSLVDSKGKGNERS